MKKTVLLFVYIFVFMFAASGAHGQITEDETAGKAILEKLQRKEVVCANLTDNDFNLLGDYYMGEMMGSSHKTWTSLWLREWANKMSVSCTWQWANDFRVAILLPHFPRRELGFFQ